jgi:hypothetical protein
MLIYVLADNLSVFSSRLRWRLTLSFSLILGCLQLFQYGFLFILLMQETIFLLIFFIAWRRFSAEKRRLCCLVVLPLSHMVMLSVLYDLGYFKQRSIYQLWSLFSGAWCFLYCLTQCNEALIFDFIDCYIPNFLVHYLVIRRFNCLMF